jgi:hypothetical protein
MPEKSARPNSRDSLQKQWGEKLCSSAQVWYPFANAG